MRLGTIDTERLLEPFAPEIVHPKRWLAGGQEKDRPDQGNYASHRYSKTGMQTPRQL